VNQFVVRAGLRQPSVFQNQNQIRAAQQTQPAGNHKRVRPVIASRRAETISFSVRASTDAVGSSRIKIGGCSNQRARQREPLALAAGQIHARFAQHGFVAVRQRDDEIVRRRDARRALDLFHRGVRMAERDVGRDGVREQKTFLIDNADLPAERVQVQLAQILSVRENAAGARIVKTRNQTEQRTFARAGHAENADDLAGLGGERNFVSTFFSA
jgi:hypothetical protein